MSKRRQQAHSTAIKEKKSRRIVNNNEHEDEDGSDSETERSSICSASSQLSISSQVLYSRCGKILAVKLRNFMCHENLTVDFNSNCNLLIGKNGSGKSAVLTALIIGLGSKANATNRSTSIKQLIKTGEASATIEVHLSNDGYDCYEKEKFGNKIIVIRHVSASGSSTYKLKNERGDVVSTKRADLLKLVFYMNIQVDNPVCVLTQDAARGFLRDSDPKTRYDLFQRATQLNIISEKLEACSTQLKSSKDSLEVQQERSEELKKKKEDAELLISRLNSVNPIKEEISLLKCAKKWVTVAVQEALLQEIKDTLDETTKSKDDLIRKTQTRENDVEMLNEQFGQINSSIDALIQSSSENRQRCDAQRNTYRELTERLEEKTRDVKRIESKKERITRDINKLEERVTNNDNNEVAQLKAEHQQLIEGYQNRITEIDSIITNSKRDIVMMLNTESQHKMQIEELEAQRNSIAEDIVRTRQQLQQLNQNTPNNSLRAYGEYMPAFVNDIKRLYENGKFSNMPIGPLGDMIEVKNPKYRKYIEDLCSKYLYAFIVDNAKDSMVLKNLVRSKYSQAKPITIITRKFRDRVYDVRGKRVAPDSRYDVLMDAVNIENPNVMNCFIDVIKADSLVFVTKFEDATHLTDKIENVPPNLSRVLLLEPYSEFYPAPSYRSYSRNVTTARFLRVTSSVSEEYFTTELEKSKGSKTSIEADILQVKAKLAETVRMLNERKDNQVQLERERRGLDLKKYELQTYEYPEETEVAVMTREINAQKKILAETDAELSVVATQKRAMENEVSQVEAAIKEIRRTMKNLDDEKLEKQKEKDKINEEIHKRTSTANLVQRQIQQFTDAIDKFNNEYNIANAKREKLASIAQRSGDRPQLAYNEAKLDELIKAKERKINMIDSSKVTIEQAKDLYEECKKNYEENEDIVASLHSVINLARDSTRQRFNTVKRLKQGMMTRVTYYFGKLMELRKFKGDLQFNVEDMTLELKVIPRDKDHVTEAGGINTLSGGERSYVTVSLLMSLWKCVDHPFFFLDEYDVFTDHVNRKYLTDILLSEANKHPEYQYTFLTPQDIANITPSETLAIQRLNEPTR